MNELISGDNISYIFVLAALGLVPLAFMACTSYLKISIVLSVLRNALGGGQIPSQAMSGVISLVLSIYTMAPVFSQCIEATNNLSQNKPSLTLKGILPKVVSIGNPLLNFMRLNTALKERAYFLNLHKKRVGVPSKNLECNQNIIIDYQSCIGK